MHVIRLFSSLTALSILLPVNLVMTTPASSTTTTTNATTTTTATAGAATQINVIIVAPFVPPGIPLPLPPLVINGTLVDPITLQPILLPPGFNLTAGLPLPGVGGFPFPPFPGLPFPGFPFPGFPVSLLSVPTAFPLGRSLSGRSSVLNNQNPQYGNQPQPQPQRSYNSYNTDSNNPYSAVAATLSQSGGLALNPFTLKSDNLNDRQRCSARQGLGTVTIPLTRQSSSTLSDRQCNALGELVRNYVFVYVESQPAQQDEDCVVDVPNIRVQCSSANSAAFAG